jgi:DNA modification methylase
MQIEMMSIESLKEYERNPRTISDEAVNAVAKAIAEFGFKVPILIDGNNTIIAGHTRLRAARKLGLQTVPVIRADDLSPSQVAAFRLADNQLSTLTKWDYELLPLELADLQEAGVDLSLLAFDADDLVRLLGGDVKAGLCDPDEVPLPPDQAITQPGDLWILGEHRLLCGDSGSVADVDRLLDGANIHLVCTDPPYGVRVEPRSNNAIAAGLSSFSATHHQGFDVERHPEKAQPTTRKLRPKDRPLVNDFVSDEEFDRLLHAWFGNIARVLEPGRGFYVWGGYANLANYPPVLKKHGLYFSQGIVWDKQHPVLTRKDYMGAFEICFYGWKEGAAHVFLGPNNATDLWHIPKVPPQKMCHLTEKPVLLSVKAIQYSSRPGENVLELFGGSGSTLIACEQTGRKCFAMEIDALYADTIATRWQNFTGRQAERVPARNDCGLAVPAETQ